MSSGGHTAVGSDGAPLSQYISHVEFELPADSGFRGDRVVTVRSELSARH